MWYSFPRLLFCLKTFSRTCLRCLSVFHQLSSVAELCLTLCDPMDYSIPGFPMLYYLLEFAQTHVHYVSDTIQKSHPLSSPSPPAFILSQHQGLYQWVDSWHQVAKYWSVNISPSSEFSGLIPFKIDWLDLLAAEGTLKSLLQHHSSGLIRLLKFQSWKGASQPSAINTAPRTESPCF